MQIITLNPIVNKSHTFKFELDKTLKYIANTIGCK